MPTTFNQILQESGLKLSDIRLIRHKDKRALKGRSPYELWCDNRLKFEEYQSIQKISNRSKLNAPYWAVFVVNDNNETVFAGLYSVHYVGLLQQDQPMVQRDEIDKAFTCDVYKSELEDTLQSLIGKVKIEWGPAKLAWVQYADRQIKTVINTITL
jgi:hypothetical protein